MKEKETKGRKALLAIAMAVAATMLAGCDPMSAEQRNQILQAREQAYKAAQTATAEHLFFFKVKFDGHSYVVYEHFGYRSGGPAIVHDPDCPCQKGGAL